MARIDKVGQFNTFACLSQAMLSVKKNAHSVESRKPVILELHFTSDENGETFSVGEHGGNQFYSIRIADIEQLVATTRANRADGNKSLS